MFHNFIRYFILFSILFLATAMGAEAQPCADTQPVIAGSQVVSNNQAGVIYSTPNIPGHSYAWSITGGTITSGAGTNQVSVTWGAVGSGTITVQETNPLVPCSTSVNKSVSVQPLLISYFYYTNTSCYGDNISFHDASVADAAFPIVQWEWNFGDLSTSTLQNPTHQYQLPYMTTWSVTLIVTNSIGYKDTIYDAVYVNPNQFIPTAAFSSSIPNCLYTPVTFDASASTTPPLTGKIIHWSWNFGDPASGASNIYESDSTKTGPLASHKFSSASTFTVTVEVTNNRYCKSSVTHTIVLTPSVPTAQYIYSSPTCLGNPVNFTDQSVSPAGHNLTGWQWNFGDGSNININKNAVHVFPGLGPYQVQVKVTNDLGCSDSIRKSISLDPSPLSNFTWDSKCFGDTIKFQNVTSLNNGPPIASSYWDFGDPLSGGFNNSSALNPNHIFSAPGTYTVTLVSTNTSGCPDSIQRQLTMFPPPSCDYTYQFGAINQQVLFHIDSASTNAGAIGNMVLWQFGDGTYGYGWNPTHIYPSGGTFDVTLTVTDTIGCKNSVMKSILVPALPMAFFSSNSPVCFGNQPVCFNDLSNAATPPFGYIQTWIWNFGDGTPKDTIHFPNDPNVCHTYATADTFGVQLQVFDNSGFSDSITINVLVVPDPVANFFYSSTLCPDQLVYFTDASFPNGGGNIISWKWDFGDPGSSTNNFSNQPNPSHIFVGGGVTYDVRLIVENFNGCTDTMIKPVYIHPKPPVNFTYDTACLNQLVHFMADTLVTHKDSIASWSWNFGDGTPLSTDPINTSHLFNAVGIYTVTLTITDIHGCINSVSHTIEVNPLPVAAFSWNTPTCHGSAVQFTDESYVDAIFAGYVAKWKWEFGDGSSQTISLPNAPNTTHTYTGPTLTWLVRLTVWTNDSCSSFIEKTINLIPAPIANFDTSFVRCENQPVQFTDQTQTNGGGPIITWSWDFGEPSSGVGNFSPLPSPTHSYQAAGTYTVMLAVTNANNCHDTIRKTININLKPVANFKADTVCQGNPTTFTDLSQPNATAIVSYSWDFGDSSPLNPQPNPTHSYSTYGIYTVTLSIVNSNGCTHSVSKQVLVNPLPTAAYSFSTPNCQGTPVCFINQSTTPPGYLGFINQWVWDFGDGVTQTVNFPANPNVCHTFAGNALTHTVRLTVKTSDGCTHFIDHTVNSVPSPIADFYYSTTNCAGQTVNFTDNTQLNGGGAIISWSWNFGEPSSGSFNFSTLPNPTHSYSTDGAFIVTLIVNNLTNCPDTIVKTIIINKLPIANFTADTVCFNNLTSFNSSSSQPNAAGIVSWSWNFGDASPLNTQPNPTHLYTSYGLHTVTLTIVNSNGCIGTTTKQVLVHPLPIPEFNFSTPSCQGSAVNFHDLSYTVAGYMGTIVKWVWDFNDGTPIVTVNFPANPDVFHTFAGGSLNHLVRLTIKTADSCTDFIEHNVSSVPAPTANFNYPATSCAGQSVQFNDQSQMNGGGPIISWKWDFGDPGSGGANIDYTPNPVHVFSTSGTFNVSLIVGNSSGCYDTTVPAKIVTVNAKPVAQFTADSACLNSLTTFTNTSSTTSGAISGYYWTFGDGGFSTQQNPTHLYTNPGTYNVTLTVTTTLGCTKDTTEQVIVHPKPVASFYFSSPTCVSDSVHFTDISTTSGAAIVKWRWYFGDGASTTILFPTSPDVSHKYNNAGTFNVTLIVTTSDSCSHTKMLPVTVQAKPTANFKFENTRCALSPVQFTDLSQATGNIPVVTWLWDFGDPNSGGINTSTIQDPLHPFSAGGTFNVHLLVTNANGCTDTITKSVVVNDKPVSKFKADTVCLTTMTTFTDLSTSTSGTISIYAWNFGDGGTSTQQNPTHLYLSSGNFNVTLTVTTTLGCIKDTVEQVLVHPNPVASFFFSSPTCAGDSVHFTDLSSTPGAAIVKWVWDFDDGGSTTILFPTPPNVNHQFTTGGTFNVKLTVTTSDSCSNFIILPVTIQAKPAANFEYAAITCAEMPLLFTDLSQPTGGVPVISWAWDFGDPASGTTNTSTLQNPSHSFSTGGSFNVHLFITNASGCTDSITKPVSVNAAPVAQFTTDTACVGTATQFTDGSTAGSGNLATWAWDFGEPASGTNNTSTQQNPTHTYLAPGSYSVTLLVTNTNSCQHDTVIVVNVNPKPQAMFEYTASCIGDSTHFTDLSIAPGSQIVSWSWNFDDGGTSTLQNPNHAFATGGTYNVHLLVTNLAGCVDSLIIPVVARPKPIAAYTYTNFFCPAGQVNFQDQSQGIASAIASRLWIFEPGYTSDKINPTYVFSQTDKKYAVMEIVTDTYGCTDTIVDSVYVKPGFQFTFGFDTVCFNQLTHFNPINQAQGDSLYSPVWDFGDPASGPNNLSYLYNPTHRFSQPGTYLVKFTTHNSDNCTDSLSRQVIVHALPQPEFTSAIIPCDSTLLFTDTSVAGDGGIASWTWTFGDGSPPETILAPGPGNTSHIFHSIGYFTVLLQVVNSFGCVDTISHVVQRFPCIMANYAYADTLCARYPISFSDSSVPTSKINQWYWQFGDGTDSTYYSFQSNIVHTYPDAGTYTVKLKINAMVNAVAFNDSMVKVVVIHPTPLTYFSNPGVCKNQITLFRDTSNTFGGGISKWSWTFGDPSSAPDDTSSLINPTHKYDTAGYYNVQLMVMNSWGCKDSITKPTRVYALPAAHFSNTNACLGVTTNFSDNSIIADTTLSIWRWNFGDLTTQLDTSEIQDPDYRYKTTGNYSVRMIVQDNYGCLDTVDSLVTVNVSPVSAFTYTNNLNGMTGKIQLNNLSSGATMYNWDFGNGQTSTEENPTATYSMDGTYVIKLVSLNEFNCTDTTFYKYEVLFKGLYVPNAFAPNSTNLSLRLFKPVGTNLKQYDMQVYDSWGHLLFESNKLDTEGRPLEGWDGTYNGNLMPQGTYMWKASATFIDDTIWQGSDIGMGSSKTMGTVSLIR